MPLTMRVQLMSFRVLLTATSWDDGWLVVESWRDTPAAGRYVERAEYGRGRLVHGYIEPIYFSGALLKSIELYIEAV